MRATTVLIDGRFGRLVPAALAGAGFDRDLFGARGQALAVAFGDGEQPGPLIAVKRRRLATRLV